MPEHPKKPEFSHIDNEFYLYGRFLVIFQRNPKDGTYVWVWSQDWPKWRLDTRFYGYVKGYDNDDTLEARKLSREEFTDVRAAMNMGVDGEE